MKLFISHGLCQLWILAYASHYTEKVIAKITCSREAFIKITHLRGFISMMTDGVMQGAVCRLKDRHL